MTEAQKRAQKKYDEANKDKWRMIHLKLNKDTDSDIISRLEDVENIQGYIKKLIRADKEGQWVDNDEWDVGDDYIVMDYFCSRCFEVADEKTDYCPHCGTKMKK